MSSKSPSPSRPTEAASLQEKKKNSKSAPRKAAGKNTNHGERYKNFCTCADKNPNIKSQIALYLKHLRDNKKILNKNTSTGKEHEVYDCTNNAQMFDDLRVVIPKSKDFGKAKDGKGIYSMLTSEECGYKGGEKITLTWLVAYEAGVEVDTTKEGWKFFECSHLCCDYDENGNRLQGYRCVDGKCLVFENKSDNQARANKSCRKICHCGCNATICAANKIHDPPCH